MGVDADLHLGAGGAASHVPKATNLKVITMITFPNSNRPGQGMSPQGWGAFFSPRRLGHGLAAAFLLGGLASSEALALEMSPYANGLPNDLVTVDPVALTIAPPGSTAENFSASLT